MEYTVQQLAKMAGVSVKTLHYYHDAGLLLPFRIGENGYRYYTDEERERLKQILYYRELEFPLEQIKKILEGSDAQITPELEKQKEELETRVELVQAAINTISEAIAKKYTEEALEKWGNTEAFKESQRRVSSWSKDDLERLKREGVDLRKRVGEVMHLGVKSEQVQDLMELYFLHMNKFYVCSYEMFAGLGKMYVEDERFTKAYEKIKPGLAKFMQEAMEYYRQQVVNNNS